MLGRAPTAPPLLAPSMEAWLQWQATQRRAATRTLEHYRRDLRRLATLADGREVETLDALAIRRAAAQLHGAGLGGRSIARVLSAWRGYYHWLVRQGLCATNPVANVRAPKTPFRLPKALSPDQTAALLEGEAATPLDVRDRAMFELFYSSGLRLSELTALDCAGDVDFAQGLVTVLGKGGKMRSVPVGRPALAALRAWLALRPQCAAADEPALFVTRTGRRMSAGAVRSRLALRARESGLGVHVHPHMLRHSFASHVLQSSGDLRAVQELLGHASIRSTQVYTHLDFQHLASIYDRAHPRAKK